MLIRGELDFKISMD